MFQGRCITLGRSPRRLPLHSTDSCRSTFGTHFAPYRASSSVPSCECSKYEAAGRPLASCSSPLATARPAARQADRGPGLEASSCKPGSAETTAAPASAQAGLTGSPGAGGCAAGNTHEPRGAGNGSPEPAAASTGGGCGSGDDSNGGGGADGGRACGAAAAAAGAGPRLGALVEDTTPGNWLTPLRRAGSVVALGKFDALHSGHRALAAAAAALVREIHAAQSDAGGSAAGGDGTPDATTTTAAAGDAVLLSFSGMAAVLGWPDRLPLTAPQDRGRVLAGWAAACGGSGGGGANICRDQVASNGKGNLGFAVGEDALQSASAARASGAVEPAPPLPPPPAPRLRTLPFSLIRGMAPEQFVALLARDLGAVGVVAGRNYRFGYKAAGDADTLVRLGRQYGMCVKIVDLVTLPDQQVSAPGPGEVGGGGCLEDGSGGNGVVPAASGDGGSSAEHGRGRSGRSEGGGGCGSAPISAASQQAGPLEGAAAAAAVPPAAAAAAPRHGGASSLGLRSLDGCRDAAAEGRGGSSGGGGGDGGGGLAAAAASSRVSSSRIRALLERGRVESVEQLLGRKYRLVCNLAAAVAAATAAGGNDKRRRDGGSGSCSSDNDDGDAGAVGAVGAGECSSGGVAGGAARLVLPCTSYQNQPPAHGQYRAFVQLVRGSQVPVGSGDAGGGGGDGWWVPSLPSPSSAGGNGDGEANGAAFVWAGACVTVVLSEFGLEVELGEAGSRYMAAGLGDGGLLLVDFDACG